MTVKSTGKIAIESSEGLTLSAPTISVQAQRQLDLKGARVAIG